MELKRQEIFNLDLGLKLRNRVSTLKSISSNSGSVGFTCSCVSGYTGDDCGTIGKI